MLNFNYMNAKKSLTLDLTNRSFDSPTGTSVGWGLLPGHFWASQQS